MLDPVHIPGEPNCSYDRQALAEPGGRNTGFSPVTQNEFNTHELQPNTELVLKMCKCLRGEMESIYRCRKPLVPGYLSQGGTNSIAKEYLPVQAPTLKPI